MICIQGTKMRRTERTRYTDSNNPLIDLVALVLALTITNAISLEVTIWQELNLVA